MTSPSTFPRPRRILVLGATGTLGGAVLHALRHPPTPSAAPTPHLTVLTRRPLQLPDAPTDIDCCLGDLADSAAVRSAMTDQDAVFFVSPHEFAEERIARIVVDAARESGARLVFAGVHCTGRTLAGRLQYGLFSALLRPYRAKLRIGRLIERELPDAVLFSPSNFMDNDLMFLDDIQAGEFPTPLRRVNRIAAADIGVACARALLEPDFPAGTHGLCGPESLTGAQSAAIWSDALGVPVRYTGSDPQAWAAAADRRLPGGKKGQDWRTSFGFLGKVSAGTSRRELAATTAILGRPPMTMVRFAAGVAARTPTAGHPTPTG